MSEQKQPGVPSASEVEGDSALEKAAAQGELHWPTDPALDPEGIAEPLPSGPGRLGSNIASFDSRG